LFSKVSSKRGNAGHPDRKRVQRHLNMFQKKFITTFQRTDALPMNSSTWGKPAFELEVRQYDARSEDADSQHPAGMVATASAEFKLLGGATVLPQDDPRNRGTRNDLSNHRRLQ
jgi:hypothetical protein